MRQAAGFPAPLIAGQPGAGDEAATKRGAVITIARAMVVFHG